VFARLTLNVAYLCTKCEVSGFSRSKGTKDVEKRKRYVTCGD